MSNRTPKPPSGLSLREANRQKAVALARKHQLVAARLEGELIPQ
jgi:hypothetical protein